MWCCLNENLKQWLILAQPGVVQGYIKSSSNKLFRFFTFLVSAGHSLNEESDRTKCLRKKFEASTSSKDQLESSQNNSDPGGQKSDVEVRSQKVVKICSPSDPTPDP